MVVADEEAFRHLPGAIAVARAGLALVLGDVAGTVNYARLALDLVPDGRPSQARIGGGAPGARILDER